MHPQIKLDEEKIENQFWSFQRASSALHLLNPAQVLRNAGSSNEKKTGVSTRVQLDIMVGVLNI